MLDVDSLPFIFVWLLKPLIEVIMVVLCAEGFLYCGSHSLKHCFSEIKYADSVAI